MPDKQQFFSDNPETYKGFQINQGQLFNGQYAYEAWNTGASCGFYRLDRNSIIDAIDFYVATERDSDNSKLKYAAQ